MSPELDLYKQSRIEEINYRYNNSFINLRNKFIRDYRKLIYSRFRNKYAIINNLIKQYINNINILKQNHKNEIEQVNSLTDGVTDVTSTPNKKALLVGINYINTEYALSGCIDDTNRIKDVLTQKGFKITEQLTDLTSSKPTKQNILNELKNMIINAMSGDILFFYFSGHGSNTYDVGGDETDGMDEMIISSDLQGILDDDIRSIISSNLKKDVTLIGLFDSCNSGTMFDLKFNYLGVNNYDKYTDNNRVSECDGNVIMISGCMDSQTSAEAQINNKTQGAMTWSFIDSIKKNPNSSWRELLKSMMELLKSNNFTQIPQLSTDSLYDIDSQVFL